MPVVCTYQSQDRTQVNVSFL